MRLSTLVATLVRNACDTLCMIGKHFFLISYVCLFEYPHDDREEDKEKSHEHNLKVDPKAFLVRLRHLRTRCRFVEVERQVLIFAESLACR
mmetsp:Transcript_7015/g.13367  ORF Transcript_7015/g.13367 Transcript_7015/m.13367 type:complete len:91 (-) Transcript_7015:1887-2159(-)